MEPEFKATFEKELARWLQQCGLPERMGWWPEFPKTSDHARDLRDMHDFADSPNIQMYRELIGVAVEGAIRATGIGIPKDLVVAGGITTPTRKIWQELPERFFAVNSDQEKVKLSRQGKVVWVTFEDTKIPTYNKEPALRVELITVPRHVGSTTDATTIYHRIYHVGLEKDCLCRSFTCDWKTTI